jgi:hypothetical protein
MMTLPLELFFVAAFVLAVLGAPLALLGVVFLRRIAEFNARCVATTGRVVAHREMRTTDASGMGMHPVFFPIVEYTTEDGRTLRADGLGGRSPPHPGTPVPLLYDRARPGEVSFTGPRGRGQVAAGLRFIGVVMLLLAPCVVVMGLAVRLLPR